MNAPRSTKTKLCPYCAVPLRLDAEACFFCKRKVRKVSRYGIAKKPVNYWSYISCASTWTGFYLYMRWAFF